MSRLCNPTEYLLYSGSDILAGDEEPFTAAFWYKSNASENGDCALLQVYSPSPNGLWMARVDWDIDLKAYSENDASASSFSSTLSPPKGTWTHVILEFAASNSRTLYVNNSPGSESTATVTLNASTSFSTVRFGAFGGGGNTHDLYVAELALWKRTLTSGERSALQTQTPNIAASGALAYWPLSTSSLDDTVNGWTFTNGAGSTAYDADHPSLSGGWFSRDRKRSYLAPMLRR